MSFEQRRGALRGASRHGLARVFAQAFLVPRSDGSHLRAPMAGCGPRRRRSASRSGAIRGASGLCSRLRPRPAVSRRRSSFRAPRIAPARSDGGLRATASPISFALRCDPRGVGSLFPHAPLVPRLRVFAQALFGPRSTDRTCALRWRAAGHGVADQLRAPVRSAGRRVSVPACATRSALRCSRRRSWPALHGSHLRAPMAGCGPWRRRSPRAFVPRPRSAPAHSDGGLGARSPMTARRSTGPGARRGDGSCNGHDQGGPNVRRRHGPACRSPRWAPAGTLAGRVARRPRSGSPGARHDPGGPMLPIRRGRAERRPRSGRPRCDPRGFGSLRSRVLRSALRAEDAG